MQRRHLLALFMAASPLPGANKIRVVVRSVHTSKAKAASEESGALEIALFGSEPFPVRALDPVLAIGTVNLANYRFSGENNEILTFYTLGDEDLRPGAMMVLQYGNDRESRAELGNFRR